MDEKQPKILIQGWPAFLLFSPFLFPLIQTSPKLDCASHCKSRALSLRKARFLSSPQQGMCPSLMAMGSPSSSQALWASWCMHKASSSPREGNATSLSALPATGEHFSAYSELTGLTCRLVHQPAWSPERGTSGKSSEVSVLERLV